MTPENRFDAPHPTTSTDGDPRIGLRLGHHLVKGILGRGGMGVVYEGENTLLRRPVAIKFLPEHLASSPAMLQRFLREAQSAARLNHPNVVTLYEVGQEAGSYFLILELVRGGNAQQFLDDNGPLAWPEATRVIAEVCRGLAAAHSAGIIHRDIKPANIMRSAAGQVKLSDFGLAHNTDEMSVLELATGGTSAESPVAMTLSGTPDYMSPEQIQGQPSDGRSDIYSLGATFYALLTGRTPFPGTGVQLLQAHCLSPVPDPRLLAPSVPERCASVVMRCMAKEPGRRFQTAEDLLYELDLLLGGSMAAASMGLATAGAFLTMSHQPVRVSTLPMVSAAPPSPPPAVAALGAAAAAKPPEAEARTPAPAKSAAKSLGVPTEPISEAPGAVFSPSLASAAATANWLWPATVMAVAVLAFAAFALWQQSANTIADPPSSDARVDARADARVDGRADARVDGRAEARADSSAPPKPDSIPSKTKPTLPPIRIGVLHSISGPMSLSEKPVVDAVLLAVEEINHAGGIRGRLIEAVVVDGRSDPEVFAREAERLLTTEKIRTVFGCWTSASRRTVRPIFERHDALLIYPVQYEGLESSPNIVYTGAAPNQQLLPALEWSSRFGPRVFLVGSDYVFPRAANAILRDEDKRLRREIVGEEYLLLGSSDVAGVVAKIAAAKPDVILNTINGDTNLAFFKALSAAGLGPDKLPNVSFSIGEDELRSLNLREVAGAYAAWNYFQSVDRPANKAFVAAFQKRYGSHRVTSDPIEAGYFGVRLWAAAAAEADGDSAAALRRALVGRSLEAPGGPIRIDPDNLHTWKIFRLGRVQSDGTFEIVLSSEKPLRPEPYPATRSRSEWEAFLAELRTGWGGRWYNPGQSGP